MSGSAVAIGLLAPACGSRTSMLDPDAYSSTGSGGAGTAGSGSTAKAGSAGDPSTPSGACAKYCNGYRVQCSAELGDRDCVATCAAEVSNRGKQCVKLGTELLDCLAPHFPATGPSQGCRFVSDRAATACGPMLSKFQNCGPESQPDRESQPERQMSHPGCAFANVVGGTECQQKFACSDGGYLVQCSTTNDGTRACSCISPTSNEETFLYGANELNPCERAAEDCGFF